MKTIGYTLYILLGLLLGALIPDWFITELKRFPDDKAKPIRVFKETSVGKVLLYDSQRNRFEFR